MFATLAKFRSFDGDVSAHGKIARPALAPFNDNVPANRGTSAARTPRPALVGRWRRNSASGRVEWHWTIDGVEVTAGEPRPSLTGDRTPLTCDDGERSQSHRMGAPAAPSASDALEVA